MKTKEIKGIKNKKSVCDHVITQETKWNIMPKLEKIKLLRVLPRKIKKLLEITLLNQTSFFFF